MHYPENNKVYVGPVWEKQNLNVRVNHSLKNNKNFYHWLHS